MKEEQATKTICIQGTELAYDEADIITFDEGLIGLPHLRRMVLVRQSNIAPFMWLASLDDSQAAFLVVNPQALFPRYQPLVSAEISLRLGLAAGEQPLALSIVMIMPEWMQSTINLRAPLLICARTMKSAQIVLTETAYKLNEPLPMAEAA